MYVVCFSEQESNLKEPKQDPSSPRKKKQKKHHQWKVEPVGSSKHDSTKQVEHLYVTVLAGIYLSYTTLLNAVLPQFNK